MEKTGISSNSDTQNEKTFTITMDNEHYDDNLKLIKQAREEEKIDHLILETDLLYFCSKSEFAMLFKIRRVKL